MVSGVVIGGETVSDVQCSLAWRGSLLRHSLLVVFIPPPLALERQRRLLPLGLVELDNLQDIREDVQAEYYFFLTLSVSGLAMLVSCVDLITLVIALEVSAFPIYLMVPMRREREGLPGTDRRIHRMAQEHADVIAEMRDVLRERGMVTNRDFEMATRKRTHGSPTGIDPL